MLKVDCFIFLMDYLMPPDWAGLAAVLSATLSDCDGCQGDDSSTEDTDETFCRLPAGLAANVMKGWGLASTFGKAERMASACAFPIAASNLPLHIQNEGFPALHLLSHFHWEQDQSYQVLTYLASAHIRGLETLILFHRSA